MSHGSYVARHAAMHAAVEWIADNGMADRTEVHANLMRAPGVDGDLRELSPPD